MAQLRILIIGEVFHPEEFLINDLALEWKKKGFRVDVLTRVPSYPQDKIYPGFKNKIYQKNTFEGITIHRFPVILGYQRSKFLKILNYINFVFWGSIVALLIGKKYDRIFIYQTGPLTLAIPGILIQKVYGKKVSIWTQDVWPDTVYAYGFKKTKLLDLFLSTLVKFVYTNTQNILVTCEGFIDKLKKYVPNKEIVWIPNWSIFKGDEIVNEIKLKGKFNFTFSGNVGKVQNLENVIIGFGLFQKKFKEEVFLNIVGDGSHLELLKSIVEEGTIKNVIFHGRKPLQMMPAYFNASDVLIVSLVDEDIFRLTVPLKFQVYLSAQKPIMGVIEGEVKDIILKYGIGKVANPSDVNSIASVFEEFVGEGKAGDTTQLKVKELNEGLFKREKIIAKLTSIVEESITR